MKKLITFSLYGDNPIYLLGAINNLELINTNYSDWKTVFYVGNTVPDRIVNALKKLGAEIVNVNDSEDWGSTMWRFNAVWQMQYDYLLSRDCDSRICDREMVEVEKWIESEKIFHVIKGHPFHLSVPILAGTWGIRNNEDMRAYFEKSIKDFIPENRYQTDQDFLSKYIYPKVASSMYISDMLEMPPASDYSFIGEPFNEHNEPLDIRNRAILKKFYDEKRQS